jgi:hypothetical protein
MFGWRLARRVGLDDLATVLRRTLGAEPAPADTDHEHADDDARRQTALAEFSALRQEIGARSGVQHQLMALNITALTAIGGFVISDQASPLLLLMLPIVSPALGFLWHDHDRNIQNIGTYIRDEVKPILVKTSGADDRLLSYEERIDEYERRRSSRLVPLAIPLFVLFAGFSAVALVLGFFAIQDEESVSFGVWVVWALGILLVSAYLWLWFSFVQTPYAEPRVEVGRLWTLGRDSLRELEAPYGFQASEGATGLYSALFGRDSLWTLLLLLEAADLRRSPSFSDWVRERGELILRSLAESQATAEDDAVEAQPGKIVHELREHLDRRLVEMEMPFAGGKSYAGFDQTFLFVIAYAGFARRFAASPVVEEVWPNVEAALDWIERYADDDGDGFFEYRRRDPRNPINQVWKDSFDSAVVTGFDVPPGPLAWIEVQGYAYRTALEAAELYRARGNEERTRALLDSAADLRDRTFAAFWMADEECFALALDGRNPKRPISMAASNAAHALWAGLVDDRRAEQLIGRLRRPDLLSAYGLRTLTSRSPFFAPFTYHRGNVWPFDNAVLAVALDRLGRTKEAVDIAERVCHAVTILGSAIELYVVLDGGVLRSPTAGEGGALAVRRWPPENRTQAFTAAALLYFAALLARQAGAQLPDA